MGEIAEMILEGDMCDCCGAVFDDDGPGYPRTCDLCQDDD
jgi:hypothetical protein